MPWVIWDILVPMLGTFIIGLAAGWLLWRWRRQKVDVAALNQQTTASSSQPEADNTGNVVLIKERDDAVARADTAEAELEILKGQFDLSDMGIDEDQDPAAITASAVEGQMSEKAAAEIETLTRQLAKEKESKAEVERSLIDVNKLYKDKSLLLDQEGSSDEANSLKDVAALESNLKKADETIATQQAKIKQLEEHEQTSKQKYEHEIAVKEALLKQERADREEARMQLAREKLVNEQAVVAVAAARGTAGLPESKQSSNAVESSQSTKVHQLSVNTAEAGNQAIESDVNISDESSQANVGVVTPDDSLGQVQNGPQNGPVQSLKNDALSGTVQSSQATIGQSGVSAGVSAGGASAQASVAHAESTPIPETEEPVVDEVVEDVTNSEALEVEDKEQERTEAEEPAAAVSAFEDTDTVAKPVPENVTSINTSPRKSAATELANDTQDVKQPADDFQEKLEPSTSANHVPKGWEVPKEAPSDAERDNLQDIKGIGPVLEKTLHETGIYYFRQIALLDATGVQELDDQLSQFSGRIERENWVEQANTLHQSKYGSAA